jgi:hypothetical protein
VYQEIPVNYSSTGCGNAGCNCGDGLVSLSFRSSFRFINYFKPFIAASAKPANVNVKGFGALHNTQQGSSLSTAPSYSTPLSSYLP